MVYRSIQKYTARRMNIVLIPATIPMILPQDTPILLEYTSNKDFYALAIFHLTSSCKYVSTIASNKAEASGGLNISTDPMSSSPCSKVPSGFN